MNDKYISRTAAVLIINYNDDAAIIAANQVEALLDQGDVEGQRV